MSTDVVKPLIYTIILLLFIYYYSIYYYLNFIVVTSYVAYVRLLNSNSAS